ncbi:MAG: universal stress protein [Thermoplasmata archaeon]|nr:universal stress protein [Thermoplasmata archaeon]
MVKTVLVPTDGSGDMERILAIAVDIANTMGAKIYGVYVVDLTPFIGFPEDEVTQAIKAKLYEEGWNALRAVEKFCRERGSDVEVLIEEGNPAERIIKTAKKLKVDLIVMGTRQVPEEEFLPSLTTTDRITEEVATIGRTLTRKLFGSTAEKVIAGAHCDVLAVPIFREE